MINMKLHCLAVQSVLGEQCGELIWSAEYTLNGTLLRGPGIQASHDAFLCRARLPHLGPEQNYGHGGLGRGHIDPPYLLEIGVGRSITSNWHGIT